MLEYIAPLSVGAVVGWLIFYFIRRYNKFTPSMLVATIAAILGGDGISSLALMGERFGSRDFHLWYLAGVAAGFFVYGIYVLLVSIFYNRGKIRDKGKFDRMPPEETEK